MMQESMLDAASAVMSCSPAFVYMFIEALADGGVLAGLPRGEAQELAAVIYRVYQRQNHKGTGEVVNQIAAG